MKTLRDLGFSIVNRKQITVLGLDKWLLDEFDMACADLPEDTTYSPPNPSLRGSAHLIDGIVREVLDSALYICAAFRSQQPGINLGTVIVMKSAATTLSNSIINLHIMIESAAAEFRATKHYLDCLDLSCQLRRPEKCIPYRDLNGKGMKIEARNMHFGYCDNEPERMVLRGLSFNIAAGETIGIVGYNGYISAPVTG
jgi:ABC-type multidrug transport system fused ATPase/permease subunit